MARRGKRRARLNGIVLFLAGLLIVFCVAASLNDKLGLGLDIPGVETAFFSEMEQMAADFLTSLDSGEEAGAADQWAGKAPAISGSADLEVHFIDVGQGKSILIKSGAKTALIDVGENGQGITVINYLKQHKVDSIDILIGTHPHSDHIGDMDEIIETFDIGKIILPDIPEEVVPTTKTYTDLLLAIAKKGLKITFAESGDRYNLGEARLTVLGPVKPYTDLNDLSIVTRLDYEKVSFLFTGDIEKSAEMDLLESGGKLSADVLDVAHHGSKTSSSQEFLTAVKPRVAVISCGVDNSYGHPAREAVQSLLDAKTELYRTDLDGSVVIRSDGTGLDISTEK